MRPPVHEGLLPFSIEFNISEVLLVVNFSVGSAHEEVNLIATVVSTASLTRTVLGAGHCQWVPDVSILTAVHIRSLVSLVHIATSTSRFGGWVNVVGAVWAAL